jgi:hypothetical protein
VNFFSSFFVSSIFATTQYVLSEFLTIHLEYCSSHEHLQPPNHVRWVKW